MGNSCSKKSLNKNDSSKIYADEDSAKLHQLDSFVDTASVIYSIDSVKLLLSSDSGRDAYYQFLKSEHATENLNFFQAVDSFSKARNGQGDNLKADIANIDDKFLLP